MPKQLLAILFLLFVPIVYMFAAERALYVVTAKSLNVRRGPSAQHYAYGTFKRGDTILVKGISNDWATVQDGSQTGYVSTRYIRYVRTLPEEKRTQKNPQPSSVWEKLYSITKTILFILALIVVIDFFVSETIAGVALLMLIICGAGALIGWLFYDNGKAGAVVAMGIETVFLIMLVVWVFKSNSSSFPRFTSLSHLGWSLISLPFFILNLLQFWLSKPWRPFMKRNVLPDKVKPAMRTFLRVLQVPFYCALFPLRFINAVYYNNIIYNLYALSNYIVEVFVPSDNTEGAYDAADWFKYLPKRIGKYLLWHGTLTIVESAVWTIIDTFVPAVTLYHGTAEDYADNMLCNPSRNHKRQCSKGWLTGVWNVGGGNYAGDGIYFGIFRKTLRNYEQGSAIATRVTMGKTIDTVLMPDRVYNAAGHPDATAVSNWGLNNGYVCGEWWRSDRGTNWWEICMYDRQNRYNESWRIRPIYAIHSHSAIMQRIPGGPAHWLFRRQVISDIGDTLNSML